MAEISVQTESFQFDEPCPIRDVLDRIGDQWSLLVLEALEKETMRFNALRNAINDISKQMLSKTLRKLEQDGYVHRTIYPQVPPRVDYELTALGRSFLEPMSALVAWSDRNHRSIVEARQNYGVRDASAHIQEKVAGTESRAIDKDKS